jgi:hypothetical protein
MISTRNVITTLVFSTVLLTASPALYAQDICPSEATIVIRSSGYSGRIDVEFRKGNRPGSSVIGSGVIQTSGQLNSKNVCPGRYFFSFGTPDSDAVHTTRYFDATFDGERYSAPTITVTYSRSNSDGSQAVSKIKKGSL